MLVAGRACTLLVLAALGAGVAQASAASDLEHVLGHAVAVAGSVVVRLLSAWQWSRRRRGDGRLANPKTTNPFSSISPTSAPMNDSFGYNFQSGN